RRTQVLAQTRGGDPDASVAVGFDHLNGHLSADRSDLTLNVADPSFSRVMTYDRQDRLIRELDVLLFQPVCFALFPDEILLGNLELFGLSLAWDANNLHPILQRPRDSFERVSSGDEHHLGQIIVAIQVMVVERAVLLRIEYFEQRRRGIT